MLEKMIPIIAEQLNCDGETIGLDTSFKDDLGADSLDLFELVMALEEEYGLEIPAEELADVAIFLLGIAEMKGIDLQKEIEKKEKINESRECVTNELGHRVHKT